MIKIISIAISAMVVLLASFFVHPETEVTIISNVVPHLIPGEECVVNLTLNKGNASGYAMLQQVLPLGWTAIPVETMGAKFEVEDNVAKFIWTSLPGDNSINVSYKFQTDPNATDNKSVPGAFFYTENNQSVKVDMDPIHLNFTASTTPVSSGEVERKIFAITPESGEYKVVLSIHPRSGENTARFVDNIPAGFTVSEISSSGAKFMFSDQKATFLWSQLPAEPIIKISYNLVAQSDKSGNPEVSGMLVYGGDDESKTNVASASTNVIPDGSVTASAEQQSQHIAENLVAQENEKSTAGKLVTYIPAPQKGIFYKIQIAATRKSPLRDDRFFQQKYHFDQHVDLTEQNGWRKYMVGNFDSYASASSFSQRTKEKIPDAFVVAYRNADRISIKEARTETVEAE
ncbi:MAG: hypothetical protein ABI763_07520 [Bacteroidota bacterium]